jgi:hypothetical protein
MFSNACVDGQYMAEKIGVVVLTRGVPAITNICTKHVYSKAVPPYDNLRNFQYLTVHQALTEARSGKSRGEHLHDNQSSWIDECNKGNKVLLRTTSQKGKECIKTKQAVAEDTSLYRILALDDAEGWVTGDEVIDPPEKPLCKIKV